MLRIFLGFALILFAVNCQAQDDDARLKEFEARKKAAQKAAQEKQKKQIREAQKVAEKQQLMLRMVNAAQNPIYRKELEISDEQAKAMRDFQRQFEQEFVKYQIEYQKKNHVMIELRQAGQHEKAMAMQKELQQEMMEQANLHVQKVEKILLPHQITRMKQISRQQVLLNSSGFHDEFGLPYVLADELELSQEQKEKLLQTIEEARKEYYEKVESLRVKTREKIMKSLPASKRTKVTEILGEFFDDRKKHRELADEARKTR